MAQIKVLDRENGAVWIGHCSSSKDGEKVFNIFDYTGIKFSSPVIATETARTRLGWGFKITKG